MLRNPNTELEKRSATVAGKWLHRSGIRNLSLWTDYEKTRSQVQAAHLPNNDFILLAKLTLRHKVVRYLGDGVLQPPLRRRSRGETLHKNPLESAFRAEEASSLFYCCL